MSAQHRRLRSRHVRSHTALVLFLLLCLLVFPAPTTHAVAVTPALWAPNGPVSAMTSANDTIYLGGLFNQVDPVVGSFVALDEANGSPDSAFPRVDGGIAAIAPDGGGGGWYIGGQFASIDDVPRKNIAHIKADKGLDMAWNPGTDASVSTIAVGGSAVYLGGRIHVTNRVSEADTAAIMIR